MNLNIIIRPLEHGIEEPSSMPEELGKALDTLDIASGYLSFSVASDELQDIARELHLYQAELEESEGVDLAPGERVTYDTRIVEECVERLWILENDT
jgi:hypothetical protein